MISRTKRFFGVATVVAITCATALGTGMDVQVLSGGSDTVTVDAGDTVYYEVIGVLTDDLNEGLALVLFDLSFTGGDLSPADEPTGDPTPEDPMANFARDLGITNPDPTNPDVGRFGGTVIDGDLIQVGGAQNTINNYEENAPYPIGSVIPDVAKPESEWSPVELVTGSLTAPVVGGTYTLSLVNLAASVIREGETGDPFWVTDLIDETGTTADLTIDVIPAAEAPDVEGEGARYLAITPNTTAGTHAIALFVTPACGGRAGKYVGAPTGPYNIATLVNNPDNAAFLSLENWADTVHVTGAAIAPGTAYEVQADYGTLGSPVLSSGTVVMTWAWGNLNNSGPVDLADILCMLDAYADVFDDCSRYAADLAEDVPTGEIDIEDITAVLDAFMHKPYPYPQPCP